MSGSVQGQVAARNLEQSFLLGRKRIDVLRGIDLDIHEGEAVFLCGKSGAGKTTLLYTLAGLEHPKAGHVYFEGHDIYAASDSTAARIRNSRIGFVFQGFFLLPELTAIENVRLPGMIGNKASREAAIEALDHVGLSGRLHHLPAELSGGEQQRVAIARAIVNDPGVIFADEPTGNLDSKTGEGIMDLLLDLVKSRSKTLVVVTHDNALASKGDRRLEILDGILK